MHSKAQRFNAVFSDLSAEFNYLAYLVWEEHWALEIIKHQALCYLSLFTWHCWGEDSVLKFQKSLVLAQVTVGILMLCSEISEIPSSSTSI